MTVTPRQLAHIQEVLDGADDTVGRAEMAQARAELKALVEEWTKLKAVVQARAALPEGGNERAVLRSLETGAS